MAQVDSTTETLSFPAAAFFRTTYDRTLLLEPELITMAILQAGRSELRTTVGTSHLTVPTGTGKASRTQNRVVLTKASCTQDVHSMFQEAPARRLCKKEEQMQGRGTDWGALDNTQCRKGDSGRDRRKGAMIAEALPSRTSKVAEKSPGEKEGVGVGLDK